MHKLSLFAVGAILVSMSQTSAHAQSSWNPVAALNVSWASDFIPITNNVINVKTHSRLSTWAIGDGTINDSAAIRGAISLASTRGGGIVYFPPGHYKILTPSDPTSGSPLRVPSRVILQGNSSSTSLLYSLYNRFKCVERDGWRLDVGRDK